MKTKPYPQTEEKPTMANEPAVTYQRTSPTMYPASHLSKRGYTQEEMDEMMKYDPAAGTAAFSWDGGKPTIRKIANAANLAPAGRALVIGDRYSSTRMPFKGIISKIVLSSVEAPAPAPAPAEKK